MSNYIRWKQGDYIKLGKAVAQFNRKRNELINEENSLYLPEEINYKEAKENITTRRELNRIIKNLKDFQKEGAETLYTTDAGEKITNWERNVVRNEVRSINRGINKRISELNEPISSGYSRAQMGSLELRQLTDTKNYLNTFEKQEGYRFKNLVNRIHKWGKADFGFKRAITYRLNYIETMKKYSELDNYDKLMEKLNSITDPDAFYKFVSATDNTKDLTMQSDQNLTQLQFNSFLEDLGIEVA